ncbi:TPA: hypothetical protein ACX6Q6_003028 [Photobacterium damselae]
MKKTTMLILVATMAAPAIAANKEDQIFMGVEAMYQCGVKYEDYPLEKVFEVIYNASTSGYLVTNESLSKWGKENKKAVKSIKKMVNSDKSFCLKVAANFFKGAAEEAGNI